MLESMKLVKELFDEETNGDTPLYINTLKHS